MKAPDSEKYNLSPTAPIVRPESHWAHGGEKLKWRGNIEIGGGRPREVVLDFGREVGGRLCIFWGAVAGGQVKAFFSESLEELQPDGDSLAEFSLSSAVFTNDHTYRGEGNTMWRDHLLRGGFRYVLLRADRGVRAFIREVEVEPDFFIPYQGRYHGAFECSDAALNKIWYGAAYTMQVATKHPWESFVRGNATVGSGEWVIFDGAKRDRTVWNMDLAVCIPGYMQSLWRPDIVKNSLTTPLTQKGRGAFALRPKYIPHSAFPLTSVSGWANMTLTFSNYVLWWIRGVVSYYLYSGDMNFARDCSIHIEDGLSWFETQCKPSPRSKTPLFFANGLNDLSWDYTVNRIGFSGATNLLWAKTLEETAWMLTKLNDRTGRAGKYMQTAAAVRRAVFEKGFRPNNLYDEKHCRFRHTTLEDKPLTLEANAYAVMFDFVTGADAGKLLDLMEQRLRVEWGSLSADKPFPFVAMKRHNSKVIPCLVAFEVAALAKRGRFKEALALTRRTWTPMLEHGNGSTFWEWYGGDGLHPSAYASLCHPWSANILQYINEIVTGLKPIEPGCSVFELSPNAALLPKEISFARFVLPTPHGPVQGEWTRHGAAAHFSAEVPTGVDIIVQMPETVDVTESGKPVKRKKLKKNFELVMKAKA